MRKDKTTETAVFTLHGYIRNKIARALGFHERTLPTMTWKTIFLNSWLKTQIAVDDLRTLLVGSRTDAHLCCRRWAHLAEKENDLRSKEPTQTQSPEYKKWFKELVELLVEKEMAWFEQKYHRTGKIQYGWNYDDMSAEDADELPEWWFDGTKAKRKLREIRDR